MAHETIPRPHRRNNPRRTANIHMMWPAELRARIGEIGTARAVKITDIVIRVMSHAVSEGHIDRWVSTPPPPLDTIPQAS